MAYFPRVTDAPLLEYLDVFGGVLLEGPRGCGKTSTGAQHAKSAVRLDRSAAMVELAELSPQTLLAGETPRLVDEWQLAPSLWNAMRHEIDDRQARGQFILSGSATPDDDEIRHSGAGRFGRIRMRTMSLAESQRSSGGVSLRELRHGVSISARSELSYADLAAEAVRGGWPALLQASERQALVFNRSYMQDLFASEIALAMGGRRDPVRMQRLIESIARNIASEATVVTLAKDVSADGGSFAPETAREYLNALSRVFVLEPLPAYSVALRSRSRLRTKPKLMLSEPALACAALGVDATRLAGDPEFFGQVFEAMVVRDLRSLASVELGQVYHYRDNTGLEIDAILEYPGQQWAAVEVKLGQKAVAEAEKHLLTLRDERIDTDKVGDPRFLAIVTGTEFAYTLPSGVHVVPLGCLAP
ncbi:ATP-binding protein [Leucobacter insecticola]|uniref:ATP-binding protein n=1 Tax=Leucobacter insecticola TaxID=2714934 RepID=A0A6G8FHE2_9MICO|nr:DUF4143 domain-containing protein [Leucobacter insecticola]QIM15778.1 ATP-binding protein [Leucobacter insecticola]